MLLQAVIDAVVELMEAGALRGSGSSSGVGPGPAAAGGTDAETTALQVLCCAALPCTLPAGRRGRAFPALYARGVGTWKAIGPSWGLSSDLCTAHP